MTPDSTYIDSLIWGTPAHLVRYERPVLQSDTSDFLRRDDSWKAWEPKTDIPRPAQVVTFETSKPLDHIAKGVTVGSCAVIWVMLPFIVWQKLFGRG